MRRLSHGGDKLLPQGDATSEWQRQDSNPASTVLTSWCTDSHFSFHLTHSFKSVQLLKHFIPIKFISCELLSLSDPGDFVWLVPLTFPNHSQKFLSAEKPFCSLQILKREQKLYFTPIALTLISIWYRFGGIIRPLFSNISRYPPEHIVVCFFGCFF